MAQNKSGASGAVELAELLLSKGADPKARTRDGLTPASVVALEAEGSRTKKQANQDEEMRDLLQAAEDDAE